jgi:hypothetical protein
VKEKTKKNTKLQEGRLDSELELKMLMGQNLQARLPTESRGKLSQWEQNLRTNPFFMALHSQKLQREKVRLALLNGDPEEDEEEELRDKVDDPSNPLADIFKHTRVDVGDGNEAGDEGQDGETAYKLPAKKTCPFSFTGANMDVPIGLISKLGDFEAMTEDQREAVAVILKT